MTTQNIEINNIGPGANIDHRSAFSKSLTDKSLKDILVSMNPCNRDCSQE